MIDQKTKDIFKPLSVKTDNDTKGSTPALWYFGCTGRWLIERKPNET